LETPGSLNTTLASIVLNIPSPFLRNPVHPNPLH